MKTYEHNGDTYITGNLYTEVMHPLSFVMVNEANLSAQVKLEIAEEWIRHESIVPQISAILRNAMGVVGWNGDDASHTHVEGHGWHFDTPHGVLVVCEESGAVRWEKPITAPTFPHGVLVNQ